MDKPSGNSMGAYEYAALLSQKEPPELERIRRAAMSQDASEAQKMISPLQGAFMASIVRSQRPKYVLELGCFVGYSALWLAHGLPKPTDSDKPHLWTCERDTKVAQLAQENVATAGYQDTITVLAKSADTVLEEWDPTSKLDMVFIDANKSAYKRHYDLILDRDLLHDQGLIIVDNVLFHGKVLAADSERKSRIAAKIQEFNSHVANDPRTTQVLLPVFDGLLMIQKGRGC